MHFETVSKCDRLTLGRNWLSFPGENDVYSATPDQINGAIIKLENYNGTMMVISFKPGALIKVVQNALYYNKSDIIECR